MVSEKEQFAKWKEREKNYWKDSSYEIEEKTDGIIATKDKQSLLSFWSHDLYMVLKELFSDCTQFHTYQLKSTQNEDYYIDFAINERYYRFLIDISERKIKTVAYWFESEQSFNEEEIKDSFNVFDKKTLVNLSTKFNAFRHYILDHPKFRLKLLSGCMEVDDNHNPFNLINV